MKSEYPYREIAPKVYMINEFNVADCYLLVGTERALLIDMGVGLGNCAPLCSASLAGCRSMWLQHMGMWITLAGVGSFRAFQCRKRMWHHWPGNCTYRKAFFCPATSGCPLWGEG